ncbi:Response regulator transcription factor [Vibrio chagasii]|nr:Response regulator transcription factor [Vibrio chagasii]CAH7024771.1 Response regulator transcription factor [Vibrio chagasii]CAH7113989.1 Response regulator transcription factor [Vibrio chagasii]CAH7163431.1 Response regulator transcription factor [Vibrio chagasii]CAH7227820.1 Response regulator transcription factor [Vibrio chagasii]
MTNTTKISFEDLVTEQSDALIGSPPKDFDMTWQRIAHSVLDWFDIDRVTLFPNSMIMLNDGKTVTIAREGVPELNAQSFISGNYLDYLKQLRTKKRWLTFSEQEMSDHKISVLRTLYTEGGRWHGIIPLKLFGQDWGALSFSRFNNKLTPLSDQDMKRLKLICDIWLCYWQHSTMARNLKQDQAINANEGEKLLLLSPKQCSVLTLLAQGFTAKQCAEKLFLSPRTIESHKYRMIDILELENNTELIQFALRNGLGIDQ